MLLSVKKKPLDPLSMKLSGRACPLYSVERLPSEASVNTAALPSPLLLCVPIPNTSEPLTDAAPVAPFEFRTMITPLLSVAKNEAGLETCAVTSTAVFWQELLEVQA